MKKRWEKHTYPNNTLSQMLKTKGQYYFIGSTSVIVKLNLKNYRLVVVPKTGGVASDFTTIFKILSSSTGKKNKKFYVKILPQRIHYRILKRCIRSFYKLVN